MGDSIFRLCAVTLPSRNPNRPKYSGNVDVTILQRYEEPTHRVEDGALPKRGTADFLSGGPVDGKQAVNPIFQLGQVHRVGRGRDWMQCPLLECFA